MSEKLREAKNLVFDVNVSAINNMGKVEGFIAHASGSIFNPEVTLPNGGPLTIKSVKIIAEGKTFKEARENAFNDLANFLGL